MCACLLRYGNASQFSAFSHPPALNRQIISMNWERLQELFDDTNYCKRKVRLREGVEYSYSQCGNIQSGTPVLFCFGLMTSSIAVMFAHTAALEHNLRLIAIDYPGIGESTIQENRHRQSLDDHWWPMDMTQFCDTVLGRDSKVRLLGHSLGGLYVLKLLSDPLFSTRVERVVLLSPWMYVEGHEFNPSAINIARTMPEIVQTEVIPKFLTSVSSGSLQLATWSNPSHVQLQAAKIVTSYGMLQGSEGNEQMVRLALSKETPCLPRDTQVPIHVYHGTEDSLVLQSAVLKLVELLKQRDCSQVSFFAVDGADHNAVLTASNHLHQVMTSLVGSAKVIPKRRMKKKKRVVVKQKDPPLFNCNDDHTDKMIMMSDQQEYRLGGPEDAPVSSLSSTRNRTHEDQRRDDKEM